MPVFLDLPVEMQEAVVKHVKSKAVLKALSQTCQTLRAVTLPIMYDTVDLTTVQLTSGIPQSTMFSLQFAKRLKVKELSEPYNHTIHWPVLDHVICELPKSRLMHFELDTLQTVPSQVECLLQTHQQRLRNYQLRTLANSSITAIIPTKASLQNVTSIQVYISTDQDTSCAHCLLQRAVKVHSLDICVADQLPDPNWVSVSRSHMKLLQQMLGVDENGNTTNAPIKLQSLKLRRLDLGEAGTMVSAAIKPSSLCSFETEDCLDTMSLLACLAESLSNLKRYKAVRSREFGAAIGAVDRTLQVASSIDTIHISQGHRALSYLFHWQAAKTYGASLRVLYIDQNYYESDSPDALEPEKGRLDEFIELCHHLPNLQQLGMVTWKLGLPGWKGEDDFDDFLVGLQCLRELRTLRLFAQLDEGCVDWETVTIHLKDAFLEKATEELANKLFNQLAISCPHLVGVVIDVRHEYQDCATRSGVFQAAYCRSELKDVYGNLTVVGQLTTAQQIRVIEPCSDILEDEFGLFDR